MNFIIADDHTLFLEGLCRILVDLNPSAVFHKAGTGDELLALCRQKEAVDFVIMDLSMPGLSGLELIRQVRALLPTVPVVVVSASESHDEILQVLREGGAGFIPKTSSAPVLIEALKLVLAGGVYLPSKLVHADLREAPGSAGQPKHPPGLKLTTRQWELLECLRTGKSNKQIAYEMGIAEGTVKIHLTAIFRALGVTSRTQAVIAAAELLGAPTSPDGRPNR